MALDITAAIRGYQSPTEPPHFIASGKDGEGESESENETETERCKGKELRDIINQSTVNVAQSQPSHFRPLTLNLTTDFTVTRFGAWACNRRHRTGVLGARTVEQGCLHDGKVASWRLLVRDANNNNNLLL